MCRTPVEYIKSDIPEGKSGEWCLERFAVREYADYDPNTDPRPVCAKRRPGIYTRLRLGTTDFMTDLYDEWWTQREAIRQGIERGGHVLITGLGLGLVVESIFNVPQCRVGLITVIELSSDVIRLAGPHLEARYGKRLRIVNADAYTWEPPRESRFSVIWHDIWPNPNDAATAAEMARLEKRYRDYCDWQGFWPREYNAAYEFETAV